MTKEQELIEMIKWYFPNLEDQNKDIQEILIKSLKDLQNKPEYKF